MKKSMLAFVVAVGVSACQNNYEAAGQFLTNDHLQVLAPAKLNEIAKAWKNDARAVFGGSRTDADTVAWIVDFIAFNEAQGTEGLGRCNTLTALALKPLPLQPFELYDAVKKIRRRYAPADYHEAWLVNACGKQREWRVFDDPADVDNPLTVILWRAE
jgi:hypothetical protein